MPIDSEQMPPPSPQPGTTTATHRSSHLLPVLAITVLLLGVGGSSALAFLWPLYRFGNEMNLTFVITEPGADGTVFNVPLFLLGAGPSLVAATLLFVGGSIVDEIRANRPR